MVLAKQLLVVDDDLEIRSLLEQYLSKSGFAVISANDGVEMTKLLETNEPELIILDIMLPGDDGFTLCQQVRRQSSVPIIMLTTALIMGLYVTILPPPAAQNDVVALPPTAVQAGALLSVAVAGSGLPFTIEQLQALPALLLLLAGTLLLA